MKALLISRRKKQPTKIEFYRKDQAWSDCPAQLDMKIDWLKERRQPLQAAHGFILSGASGVSPDKSNREHCS